MLTKIGKYTMRASMPAAIVAPVERPAVPTDPLADKLQAFKRSFEKNEFEETARLVREILNDDPSRRDVQVRFLHVVTGLYKKTKENKILVQDVQTWSFEKKAQGWKIVGFRGESAPEVG